MRYRTCYRCRFRTGCLLRELAERSVQRASVELTSIAFRCSKKTEGLWPGRRLVARMWVPGDDGVEQLDRPGTIVHVGSAPVTRLAVLFDWFEIWDETTSYLQRCPACGWTLQYGQTRQRSGSKDGYFNCCSCGCFSCGQPKHVTSCSNEYCKTNGVTKEDDRCWNSLWDQS